MLTLTRMALSAYIVSKATIEISAASKVLYEILPSIPAEFVCANKKDKEGMSELDDKVKRAHQAVQVKRELR